MPVERRDDAVPLRAQGVCVDLGGRPVLVSADLTVAHGEVVAVLGANGSGKSTLIRAVVGLTPHRSGTIDLFGTPVEKFRDRFRLGYVPQRSASDTGVPATVTEVVLSGRLARRRFAGLATKADRIAAAEAIERVGLTDLRRRRITELSGGQHQRVLIARALATEPELMVMDEPLAGVDAESARQLAETLAELVDERHMSLLVVEHDLGPLKSIVNRTVVIDQGHVVFNGDPAEIPGEHAHHHPHSGEPTRIEALPHEGLM